MRATLPQHPFEPAKSADPNLGLVDDLRCGHVHHLDGDRVLFCGFTAEHAVHNGSDVEVRVRARKDED